MLSSTLRVLRAVNTINFDKKVGGQPARISKCIWSARQSSLIQPLNRHDAVLPQATDKRREDNA